MGKPLQFVKLSKSGGVVQRTPAARQSARNNRIKEYFYGPDSSLTPASVTLDAASMLVFRTGKARVRVRCIIAIAVPDGLLAMPY